MLSLQTIMTNLGLSSLQVQNARRRFSLASMCVTDLSGGGGADGTGLYCRTLTATDDSAHTSQHLAAIYQGCGQIHPQILCEDHPDP
jgi:hypothetical protein